MQRRLIPIGSWCRAAHQCRVHSQRLGLVATPSGPFDWTVTPFSALSTIFAEGFDTTWILNPSECSINQVGSVVCGYSQLHFHHDLPPELVAAHGGKPGDSAAPESLIHAEEWTAARDRFVHTLSKLYSVIQEEGNIFVRWRRFGPHYKMKKFPGVFGGESSNALFSLLRKAGAHPNSSLLCVTSTEITDHINELPDPIQTLKMIEPGIYEGELYERKGFNGNQEADFRGDEHAWGTIFQALLSSSDEL